TAFPPAGEEPLPARAALDEEGRPALGARAHDRALPDHELAGGVAGAPEVGSPALRPPLGELASTPVLGTRDPEGDRPGRLALGITRAGDEAAEPPVLEDHRPATGRAIHSRRLRLGRHRVADVPRVLALGIPLA